VREAPEHHRDERRDVARLDEAMRVERRRQGRDWSEVLKRGLDKRFDSDKSPLS
jgi:hypothetical protein